MTSPCITNRSEHSISRKQISSNALKVLYRLHKAGFVAYLVGGGVRDLLVGITPKDFDVVTNALPEEILKLFRNSRLIGRRFKLVHVFFYGEIVEVSTFRANSPEVTKFEEYEEIETPILIQADNTYGTIEEDAWRRDFTINALYYNIADFSVVDFIGGMQDIKQRVIRIIGDPIQRYHEDPMRLLRAIRLSAKLDFTIHPETESPILVLSHLLQHVPPARLFEEVLKMFFKGYATKTYKRLQCYGYLKVLFPSACNAMEKRKNKIDEQLIQSAMLATDRRYYKGQPINPAFLFAILLWPAVQLLLEEKEEKTKFYQIFHRAIERVIREQNQSVTIPRRFSVMISSIWILQYHLSRRRPGRVLRLVHHRYFRAAIDFLELRVKSGEPLRPFVKWWRRFQYANEMSRQKMIDKLLRSSQ